MKPNGLTMGLQVIMPTGAEDAVWKAVETAIDAGWDAKRFRREAAEAWEHRLREDAREAVRDLAGEPDAT